MQKLPIGRTPPCVRLGKILLHCVLQFFVLSPLPYKDDILAYILPKTSLLLKNFSGLFHLFTFLYIFTRGLLAHTLVSECFLFNTLKYRKNY